MKFYSAPSARIQETMRAIMAEKPLDKIVRKPTTKTMNIMTEEMAKMVATIKTTAWGETTGPWN